MSNAKLRKLSLTTTLGHQGKRLDQVLAEWLPIATGEAISKAKVRKLIVAGAVYLNRHRVRIASKSVLARARIEVFFDAEKLRGGEGTARDRPFAMSPGDVLYEDEFVIAVNKPPGLPTQPTIDEARANLYASVKKFLTELKGTPAYVGLHHRLDRDTSGVVIFTKAKEANEGTGRAFAKHLARKTYLAIAGTGGPLAREEWTVENFLAKDKGSGRFHSVRSGGDPARTEFRLIERFPRAQLVEARPLTGRTHQIRVHLAEGGMPILGDSTYARGAKSGSGPDSIEPPAPRLMLHAQRLTLPHPVTGVELVIESPVPADFQACLDRLRRH